MFNFWLIPLDCITCSKFDTNTTLTYLKNSFMSAFCYQCGQPTLFKSLLQSGCIKLTICISESFCSLGRWFSRNRRPPRWYNQEIRHHAWDRQAKQKTHVLSNRIYHSHIYSCLFPNGQSHKSLTPPPETGHWKDIKTERKDSKTLTNGPKKVEGNVPFEKENSGVIILQCGPRLHQRDSIRELILHHICTLLMSTGVYHQVKCFHGWQLLRENTLPTNHCFQWDIFVQEIMWGDSDKTYVNFNRTHPNLAFLGNLWNINILLEAMWCGKYTIFSWHR